MAKKKEKGLIGFDPLAWMNDESAGSEYPEKQVDVVIDGPEDIATETKAINDEIIDVAVDASNKEGEASKTRLDGTLNIQNVSGLYERLYKQLEEQNKIEIDASEVSSIDTATLQMLIVLKQTALKEHKDVVIDFPSEKFIEAANLLGLSEMLEVDQASAGFF